MSPVSVPSRSILPLFVSACPGLRSNVRVTCKCFALGPCSCWRSSLGPGIVVSSLPVAVVSQKVFLRAYIIRLRSEMQSDSKCFALNSCNE